MTRLPVAPRAGRWLGWALLLLTLALGVMMRLGGVDRIGPVPVPAAALLTGSIGIMLLFTDRMVRSLFAQVAAAAAAADGGRGDDGPPAA